MIKLYFADDIASNQLINEIYKRLSETLSSEKDLIHISYTYKGKKQHFDSAETIKKFLMAKDFYEYKFENHLDFWGDFINLDSKIKISNILENSSSSKNVQAFCNKYNKKDYQQYYTKLEQYYDLTIKQFKEKSLDNELQQWKHICNVFDYEKLNDKNRHQILNEMNVPVCPYCNMNYTISFLKDDVERNTADLDHFYLKSRYPEYSLCLYNFIPACPVCNQKIKGVHSMTRETHIYPHQEGFNDDNSHFKIENLVEFLIRKQEHVQIKLTNETNKLKLSNSISDLKLNERYKNFYGLAEDLIEKVEIYNESYIDSLEASLNDLFYKENIKNIVFGSKLSEKQYGRKSLGKFNQDLLCQLGIFDIWE